MEPEVCRPLKSTTQLICVNAFIYLVDLVSLAPTLPKTPNIKYIGLNKFFFNGASGYRVFNF